MLGSEVTYYVMKSKYKKTKTFVNNSVHFNKYYMLVAYLFSLLRKKKRDRHNHARKRELSVSFYDVLFYPLFFIRRSGLVSSSYSPYGFKDTIFTLCQGRRRSIESAGDFKH